MQGVLKLPGRRPGLSCSLPVCRCTLNRCATVPRGRPGIEPRSSGSQTDTRPLSYSSSMSTPGFEPGLSRPQRDVLTTRRCGPQIHCNLCEHQHYLTPGSFPAQSHGLQATHAASWRQVSPSLRQEVSQQYRDSSPAARCRSCTDGHLAAGQTCTVC